MGLAEIISNYMKIKEHNLTKARDYILPQFFKNETLFKDYLAIFICDDDGTGYDPINHDLYQIDPESKREDFISESGTFLLFEKQNAHLDFRSPTLQKNGMSMFIRKLRPIDSLYPLDSYVHQDSFEMRTLYSGLYRNAVKKADSLVQQIKSVTNQ